MNKTGFRAGIATVVAVFFIIAFASYLYFWDSGAPSGWKTYTNTQFKYEISLPSGWEQVSSNPYAFIFKKTEPGVKAENFFTVAAQQVNADLQKGYFDDLKGGSKLVTLGGNTFSRRAPFSDYCWAPLDEFSIVHGEVWFTLDAARFTGKDGKLENIDPDLINQIIGSLKFTGSAAAVGNSLGNVPTVADFSDLCAKKG